MSPAVDKGGDAAPPEVDIGDPGHWADILKREMKPTPGRLEDTVRIVVIALIALTTGEIFRLPDTAVMGFFAFFLVASDAGSTIFVAVTSGLLVIGSVGLAVLILMISLSNPALRLPVMFLATFCGAYLSRATRLGPFVYTVGFIITYVLTFADSIARLPFAAATISDTTSFSLPEGLYQTPEEGLLHVALWLSVVVAVPALLTIIENSLAGRDPELMLRSGIVDRLEVAGLYCESQPDARRKLGAYAREGSAEMLKLHNLSNKLHGRSAKPRIAEPLVHEVVHLYLVLLAWSRIAADGTLLHPYAANLRRLAGCVRLNSCVDAGLPPGEPVEGGSQASPAVVPLLKELDVTLGALRKSIENGTVPLPPAGAPQGFFKPDAFTNPVYTHFALKLTLTVAICYAILNLSAWSSIQTCIITCFFVALDTIGETVRKMMLRIYGCIVGAILGVLTVIFLMPLMTDVGHLMIITTIVLMLSGWIKTGSPRISYAGLQIALAYLLVVFQGYGPVTDMEAAKNRIMGILLGNVVVYVVFTSLWPVSLAGLVRGHLADAFDRLADILAIDPHQRTDEHRAQLGIIRLKFGRSITAARTLLVNDPFEPERVKPMAHGIDSTILAQIQALIIPAEVIAVQSGTSNRTNSCQEPMVQWFRRCANWTRDGRNAAELASDLPETPPPGRDETPETVWSRVLRNDIDRIMAGIEPTRAVSASGNGDGWQHG